MSLSYLAEGTEVSKFYGNETISIEFDAMNNNKNYEVSI